jgi:hypothetical protein
MTTVCIIPGFAEGWHTSWRLRRALERRGFVVSKNPQIADVLIAHSGGCFIVPESHNAKLILLVGLPYWPGKSLLTCIIQKNNMALKTAIREKQLGAFLRKLPWHALYMSNLPRNVQMLGGHKSGAVWRTKSAKTVLLRNRYDANCTDNPREFKFQHDAALLSLPYEHDDCWDHPELYADVVQSLV